MRAGRLRHKVQLQEPTETADSHGQPVKTWATAATVSAGVEPLRGRELETSHQIVAETTTRVVLRYRSDLTTDWRVLFGTRVFEINAVIDPDMRHRELNLMCKEMV